MSRFLNLCYFILLLFLSPLLLYRTIVKKKYREGFQERFFGASLHLAPKKGKRLWIQAVSVGEVNLLKPILKEIERTYPDWEIVISSTSQTGFDLAKKSFPNWTVFRAPLDFSWAVKKVLTEIDPDALILVELELWPNLILLAHKRGIRTVIVNGRISDQSFPGYKRWRFFFKKIFSALDLVMSGSKESDERFGELGTAPERRILTGSIKFDGVQTERENPKTIALQELAAIDPTDTVFLAGSTQMPEEEMALKTYLSLRQDAPKLRLILVPRHPERFEEVASLLDTFQIPYLRRTTLETRSLSERKEKRVLLVDTVGELGAWWGTAQIAFVGGSMGSRGGQNMLEPAAYGAAVSFGPNTSNFREISERILAVNGAIVIHSQEEMTAFVKRALTDLPWRDILGRNARELILSQRGATKMTVEQIALILEKVSG